MKRKCRIALALGLMLAMILVSSQTALAKTIYSEPLNIDGQDVPSPTETPDVTDEIAPDATMAPSEEPELPLVAEEGEETQPPIETEAPDEQIEQPAFPAYQATVNVPDGTPIYEQPSTDSRVLATLLHGDQLTVLSLMDGWAHIDIEGLGGYVEAAALSGDAPEQTQAPVEPQPISAYLTLDAPAEPKLGDQVTLNCVVTGDAENLQVVWQQAQTDNTGTIIGDWQDVEAGGLSHSLSLTQENRLTAWRVRINVPDAGDEAQ